MNILVVDDDTLIRNWLSMLLRQAEGTQLRIQEATDGVNALEFCRENPVDLVITDIKMPRMDGIDLISALKTEQPHIRTAVLSSYDDFDYVRIALKCGALDYIRKAEMQMEDIVSLLEKTRRDIELEKAASGGGSRKFNALSDGKQAFVEYLEKKEQRQEEFLSALTPPLEQEGLCLMLLRLKKQEGVELPRYMIAGVCDDTLRHEGLAGTVFPWGREYFLLLYQSPAAMAEEQRGTYQKLVVMLEKNLEQQAGYQMDNSIQLSCRREDCLRDRFRGALDIMDFRQYYGHSAPQPLVETPSGRKALAVELQKALDIRAYSQAVDVLKRHLLAAHSAQMIPRMVKQLLLSGMNALLCAVAPLEQKSEALDRLETYPTIVMDAYQKGRVELAVNRFCAQFLEQVQYLHTDLSPGVREAIRYIEANYPKKLTLDEVAAAVFLNRSYLSQLFKKETGTSFGDYLEAYRLEQAKQLIRSGSASMSEVAEKVGFSNQNYFTKVFKQATGVSPLKFRRFE